MALSEIQKRNVLILHSQGDNDEQIAKNLNLDPDDVEFVLLEAGVERVGEAVPDDHEEPADEEPDEQDDEQESVPTDTQPKPTKPLKKR